ncbi:hypothetical protein R6Z07F_012085 [Ovis aries]
MPPLVGLATPHPSPETNHCRARACTSPPPPFPGRTQPPSLSGRGPPPLKGREPALKGPSRAAHGGARRPWFPAGARRARPSPRGAQARPGALPPSAPPPGEAFLFRRRLREPGRARCIVGAAESRSREEAEGAKRTGGSQGFKVSPSAALRRPDVCFQLGTRLLRPSRRVLPVVCFLGLGTLGEVDL